MAIDTHDGSSFNEELTNYLKNSSGPMAKEIAAGDFSDEETEKLKQFVEKMLERRQAKSADEKTQETQTTSQKQKPQQHAQPHRFADPQSGTNYFTPQFAQMPQWPQGFSPFPPELMPQTQPEIFPSHFKVNPYTGEPLTENQKSPKQLNPTPSQPLHGIPQSETKPIPAHVPEKNTSKPDPSQPNKKTIEAATQPAPSLLQGQPTTEEERARQFKQRQEQDRMSPTETIDEQMDQDEDPEDLASQEEEDENANYKQIARAEIRKLKAKLQKSRIEKKNKRQLTIVTQPFCMGIVSGGIALLALIITFPGAILLIAIGAMGVLLSFFIYTYHAPARALAKKQKTPKSLKANRSAISLFQIESQKAVSRHNYDVMSDVPIETAQQNMLHSIFQPAGVFFALVSGILLIPLSILVMIWAGCDTSKEYIGINVCNAAMEAYQAVVKTRETIGNAVFDATHNTNPCPTGNCVEVQKQGG